MFMWISKSHLTTSENSSQLISEIVQNYVDSNKLLETKNGAE